MVISVEYLALILIIVYVGAVMVLFLFVVMMLDVDLEAMKASFMKYTLLGAFTGLLVMFSIIYMIKTQYFEVANVNNIVASESNLKLIADELFTNHLVSFEVAGFLLLIAIVAAICLAFRGPKNRKVQDISAQIQVTKKDRLRIIESDKWENV